MDKNPITLDDILKDLGQFGLYQLKILLLLIPFNFFATFYILMVIFLPQSPAWYCQDDIINNSPWNDLCHKPWSSNMMVSLAFLGSMFGSFLFGYFADKYGRKLVYYIGIACLAALSMFIASYEGNMYTFSVMIILCGGCMQGTYQVMYVLILEFVGPDRRTMVSIFIMFCGTISYIILPPIVYMIPNHRMIFLFLSIINLCFLLTIFFIPESPRWLLITKQYYKVKTLLDEMADYNGHPRSQLIITSLEVPTSDSSPISRIEDLFARPAIRRRITLLSLTWFVLCSTYYGIAYSATYLPGDIYYNVFFGGLAEIPAYIISILLLKTQGRRTSLCATLLLTALCCIITVVFSYLQFDLAIISSSMFGKCFVSSSFLIIYVYTFELLPTSIRTLGLGVCSLFARLGGILTPLLLTQFKYEEYIFLYFALLCGITGFIDFWLPESKGIPTPDSLDQLEDFSNTSPAVVRSDEEMRVKTCIEYTDYQK